MIGVTEEGRMAATGARADAKTLRMATKKDAGGRNRITDEELEQVAEIYQAVRTKKSTRKAVAEKLGLGASNASRYVVEARARGFLGPAVGRKAGESAMRGSIVKRGAGLLGGRGASARSGDRWAATEVAQRISDQAGGRAGSSPAVVVGRWRQLRRAVPADLRRLSDRMAGGDHANGPAINAVQLPPQPQSARDRAHRLDPAVRGRCRDVKQPVRPSVGRWSS